MSTIIAISSQKGGVAKTTTCLSLGAALAELGRAVLLVDMDPQASLTLSLGIKPAGLRYTVLDALLGTRDLVGVSQESAIFGLDIAPANQELSLVDKILYERPNYQYRLKQTLDQVDPKVYDYLLLDCSPSLGPLTMNALIAANMLVVPVQCEFYAAHALRNTLRLVRQVRELGNPRLAYRVLVTLYDMRNKISRTILEQMQRELKSLLFETVIQVDTKLRESPAFGQPIVTYAPHSRGSQQYKSLALELERVLGLPPAVPEAVSAEEAEEVERV